MCVTYMINKILSCMSIFLSDTFIFALQAQPILKCPFSTVWERSARKHQLSPVYRELSQVYRELSPVYRELTSLPGIVTGLPGIITGLPGIITSLPGIDPTGLPYTSHPVATTMMSISAPEGNALM
jgi:hypothetical protein